MTRNRTSIGNLALCALFVSLCAACSQIVIPLPMIPINLALFSVHLTGALLGAKRGSLSMVVYLLMGLFGIPVFHGFTAGPGVLLGPTGGYIIGYIFTAAIAGWTVNRVGTVFWKLFLGMSTGVLTCYLFGTLWFMALMGMGFWESLAICVFPFLIGDGVKIVMAVLLTRKMLPILRKNGLN